MAVVFKFMWAGTTVSLAAAADSGIRNVNYIPAAGDPSGGFVMDTIRIQADASSDDNLAGFVQALDGAITQAARYRKDKLWEHAVWIHAKMTNESGERRALVRSVDMSWDDDPLSATGRPAANMIRYTVRVERGPWERTAIRTGEPLAETAGTALVWDYTGGGTSYDLAGDIAARLFELKLKSDTSGAEVTRLWMGFRGENKHPSLANFVPTWELESGTNNGSESGVTDDGATDVNGASPGGASGVFVKLVETDLDWDKDTNAGIFQEVMSITLSDIAGGNFTEQYGDYLWLLRAMLPANATTWEVQLRWGYSDMADADFRRGPIKRVTATSWDYHEMGPAQNPLRDLSVIGSGLLASSYDGGYTIQIWARRTSGAADLYLDCLLPIPIDQGWAKISGFLIDDDAEGFVWLSESPDGVFQAVSSNGSAAIAYMPVTNAVEFRIPGSKPTGASDCDGRLIIAYAGESGHDLTTGISATIKFYERWLNLRGGE